MNKILVFTNNQIINQIIIPLINVSKFNIWIKLCLIYMKCVAKICYIRDVLFIIWITLKNEANEKLKANGKKLEIYAPQTNCSNDFG
jgi:hypothetical protein